MRSNKSRLRPKLAMIGRCFSQRVYDWTVELSVTQLVQPHQTVISRRAGRAWIRLASTESIVCVSAGVNNKILKRTRFRTQPVRADSSQIRHKKDYSMLRRILQMVSEQLLEKTRYSHSVECDFSLTGLPLSDGLLQVGRFFKTYISS